MSNDPKAFAKTAADALRAYTAQIEDSYRHPDLDQIELDGPVGDDMLTALPIIANFLETIFEEGGGA